jgi:hypothetical protein
LRRKKKLKEGGIQFGKYERKRKAETEESG